MNGVTRPWTADRAWRSALDEQLADELARLRLYLRRQIDWLRHRSGRLPLHGAAQDVVTDDQVLSALMGDDPVARADFYRTSLHNRAIDSVERVLRERAATMLGAGTPFPTDELVTALGLDDFVRDTLLLALATDLDASVPRLLAYAQDDAAAQQPTPALALALFATSSGERRAAGATPSGNAFGPHAAFDRLALLERPLPHDGGAATRPLRLEPRVAWYLRGIDAATEGLGLRYVEPAPVPAELEAAATTVGAVLERSTDGRRPVVNLVGADDGTARALAGAIAARAERCLHLVSVDDGTDPADLARTVARLDRESALRRTCYLVEVGDTEVRSVLDLVEDVAALVILSSHHPVRIHRPVVSIAVPRPPQASWRMLWRQSLGPVSADLENALREVVHHFDLDPEAIARVTAAAVAAARLRGDEVDALDLWRACRVYGRRRLGGLAERIEAQFTWDDIALPDGVRGQLEEIAAQVRHRATVYEDWKFTRRLPRGRGVAALFAGPSGTGKTMAAEVLARDLDLDLYRIDLAGVVNKYIGETEKNLRSIFAAAEASGAILFFDEADALFGKRTDVRDSHDRYANIEIDYLLQRMEAYTGLAILATNRKSALDRAFLRRLRFLVDFPFPAADLRLRIWQKVLPAAAPTDRVDFGALARLDLTGGNIQSIALNAAFLAAADGQVITMDHLSRAASREYAKLDQAPTKVELVGARGPAVAP